MARKEYENISSKFDNFKAPAPEGGWDAIADKINKPKRRIVPVFWYAAGLLMMTLAGGGFYFYDLTSEEATEQSAITENGLAQSSDQKKLFESNAGLQKSPPDRSEKNNKGEDDFAPKTEKAKTNNAYSDPATESKLEKTQDYTHKTPPPSSNQTNSIIFPATGDDLNGNVTYLDENNDEPYTKSDSERALSSAASHQGDSFSKNPLDKDSTDEEALLKQTELIEPDTAKIEELSEESFAAQTFEFYIAPGTQTGRFEFNQPLDLNTEQRGDLQQQSLDFQYSIGLAYKKFLNHKWVIGLGFSFMNLRKSASYDLTVLQNGELIETSYKESMSARLNSMAFYVDRYIGKRWRISSEIGASVVIDHSYTRNISGISTTNSKTIASDNSNDFMGFGSFHLGYNFLKIKSIDLFVEPGFTYFLNSLHNDNAHLQLSPQTTDLKIILIKRL